MIDTLQFSIVNLNKYDHIINVLHTLSTSVNGIVNATPMKFSEYRDTGKISYTSNGKFYVPSSHYNVVYHINRSTDSVRFSLSIPKYIWGENIHQFVSHHMDRDFDYLHSTSIKHNLYSTHKRLIAFIINLNKLYFNVDLSDLVFDRIDIAFNQFFTSANEKRMYLELLKKKKPKYTGRSNNPVYKDGVYCPSIATTKKIYDKGVEFRKDDLKHLAKFPNFNLDLLKKSSDLILRYEVEFRNRFFKTLIHSAFDIYEAEIQQTGNFSSSRSSYISYMLDNISAPDLCNAFLTRFNGKRQTFQINFNPKSPYFFNRKLFSYAAIYFQRFLSEWRVSTFELNQLASSIDRHNTFKDLSKMNFDRGIRKLALLRFVSDMEKHGKDYLLLNNLYSKTTFYRNLKVLKSLGYSAEQNMTALEFPDNWNFIKYHQFFLS